MWWAADALLAMSLVQLASICAAWLVPRPAELPTTPPCCRWRRYQSTISGSFQVVEIIETFVSYMESLDRCVW